MRSDTAQEHRRHLAREQKAMAFKIPGLGKHSSGARSTQRRLQLGYGLSLCRAGPLGGLSGRLGDTDDEGLEALEVFGGLARDDLGGIVHTLNDLARHVGRIAGDLFVALRLDVGRQLADKRAPAGLLVDA